MPCRNSPASMSACTRPMVSALQVGAGSHFFQQEARDVRPRALRLPSLAQNMTINDFTTTAVGMRGCSLRSVTGATTAAERSKIFSDHATRRRSTVTVFAPSIASIPVRRLLPTGVVSVDSPQRPGESVAPRLWHTDLTGLATMALNQIQRLMEFTRGAMAGGLASLIS